MFLSTISELSPTSFLCKKCKCSSHHHLKQEIWVSAWQNWLSAKLNHLDTRTYGPERTGTHCTNVTETPILVGCDRLLHGVPKTLNERPTALNSCILGPWAWPEAQISFGLQRLWFKQPVLLLSAALSQPCSVPLTQARPGREEKQRHI